MLPSVNLQNQPPKNNRATSKANSSCGKYCDGPKWFRQAGRCGI